MAVKLNGKGRSHAVSLIKAGKVNKSDAWEFSADDGQKILGAGKDWDAYSSWHLAIDDAEPEKTEAHYKYPFGKDGQAYRSAIVAIRQRAGQQDAKDIFDAAGELLEMIDKPAEEKNERPSDEKKEALGALGPFRFSAALRAAPWALRLEALDVVSSGASASVSAAAPRSARAGAIAVIPMNGVLTQRGYYDGGDTSTEAVGMLLQQALADDTVSAVLLCIDSPGGSVYGTGELCDLVFAANKVKPVIGIANSLAASAAYWIGSQCSEFYCTPGGEVGSIGVYTAHVDYSDALASMGVKFTLVSAGKYKTEGNPFEPLTDEAKAAIQQSVDAYYAQFTQAVARGRKAAVADVRDNMGQGRVLSAKDAKAAGMIDGIATQADVIRGIGRKLKGAQGTVAECAALPDEADEPAPISTPRLARAKRLLRLVG